MAIRRVLVLRSAHHAHIAGIRRLQWRMRGRVLQHWRRSVVEVVELHIVPTLRPRRSSRFPRGHCRQGVLVVFWLRALVDIEVRILRLLLGNAVHGRRRGLVLLVRLDRGDRLRLVVASVAMAAAAVAARVAAVAAR